MEYELLNNAPTVLILGNYKKAGNIGDDIYRRILTDVFAKHGINVVTTTTSFKKVQGVVLGGGGVLNGVSFKRLEVLQRFGETMPSAIISCGIEGCVVPPNIKELFDRVNIATVRDALALDYSRGRASLAADLAFALDLENLITKEQRVNIGFSLRVRVANGLEELQKVTDELVHQAADKAVDVNSYMRDVYSTRIPKISNVPDLSYNGSIEEYLNSLSQCGLVVCAQYHAVLLSVLCGCAVCGYIYSPKVQGLVETLGLQDYFTSDLDKLGIIYKKAIKDQPKVDKKSITNLRNSAYQTHVLAIEKMANLIKFRLKTKDFI